MAGQFVYSEPPDGSVLASERKGFDEFVKNACTLTGISLTEVMSARKTARISTLRQLLMATARVELDWQFVHVGGYFHRDHSTAQHAVKTVRNRFETNDRNLFFRQCIIALEAAFRDQYEQPLTFPALWHTQKKSRSK